MKKFLATIILSLSILIPAIQAEAAYVLVPNFYDMAVNKFQQRIAYLGRSETTFSGGVTVSVWQYTVCDGNVAKYVTKYIRKLSSKHNIQLVASDNNAWLFEYTGGQARYLKKAANLWHIGVYVDGYDVSVFLVPGVYPQ